jgi:hypothetical protein
MPSFLQCERNSFSIGHRTNVTALFMLFDKGSPGFIDTDIFRAVVLEAGIRRALTRVIFAVMVKHLHAAAETFSGRGSLTLDPDPRRAMRRNTTGA